MTYLTMIDNLFNNYQFIYSLSFLIAIYISFIQNRLTTTQLKLFYSPLLRIIYIFIIVLIFQKSHILGILLTIAYLSLSSSLSAEQFYSR